jgi:hypothetical protein
LGLVAEEVDALEIDLLGLVPQTAAEFAINDDEREHVAQMGVLSLCRNVVRCALEWGLATRAHLRGYEDLEQFSVHEKLYHVVLPGEAQLKLPTGRLWQSHREGLTQQPTDVQFERAVGMFGRFE